MKTILLEYIWLDGYKTQNLRSKTKVINYKENLQVEDLPEWSFDGSSTKQAEGNDSDCVLKPVFMCNDPFRGDNNKLVLCEVLNPDGSPHTSNNRRALEYTHESLKSEESWFGWEQEYTMMRRPSHSPFSGLLKPLGFKHDTPRPQGEYYCGVGGDNVIGREIAEDHLNKCLEVGLSCSGINAEVMIGQWEYQIGPVSALDGADQLIMSRYILNRICEKYGVVASLHPKPVKGDWNGSGCHVNFSTKRMREEGGLEIIKNACEKLAERHMEHIEVYGEDNDQRLTGDHETSPITEFSYGHSDRGCSIRIPVNTINDGYGYFEDRRPASNCDPYLVANIMLETVCQSVVVK